MIMKNMKFSQGFDGIVRVSIELTNKIDTRALQELTDMDLIDVIIKKHRKNRTLTQNAYLWKIADEIAIKLETTKEAIYRMGIKHVGVFEIIPIKKTAVDLFKRSWLKNGEGWICEELRESKLEGYINLQCYYGSSAYDSIQQSRLIDFLVEEAKEQGIDVLPPEKVKEMKR